MPFELETDSYICRVTNSRERDMAEVEVTNGVAQDVVILEDIFIPGTKQTPEISCNNKLGEIAFKGNFISSNPAELIEPIQNWLYNYVKQKKTAAIILTFHLTYLNGSSGKSLNKLFQQAEYLQDSGSNINVQLFYEDDDVDMLEWCKEVSKTYRLQFSLSKVN